MCKFYMCNAGTLCMHVYSMHSLTLSHATNLFFETSSVAIDFCGFLLSPCNKYMNNNATESWMA